MDWNLEIENKELSNLYSDYLYQQNNILTFYLASVVLNERTEIPSEQHPVKIGASRNFEECATSMKTIGDIKSLIDSGDYIQLSRAFSIFGLVTAFVDFFNDLITLLDLDIQEIKPTVTVSKRSNDVKIRPACLKTAFYIDNMYDLDTQLAKPDAMIWINCIVNIRHMFVHEKGKFNEAYAPFMTLKWSWMKHGDPITFNENDFDSVLWYFNSHLKAFVYQLTKKI